MLYTMRLYLFPLIAVVFSIFMSSCTENNPIMNMNDVQKTDLTNPLFLAYDNTLDSNNKKIWAFNDKEAVKGTISVIDDNTLRVKTDWYFDTWSLSGYKLTLGTGENKRTYDLKQASVLGNSAIVFGTTYVCTPSSNKSLDGKRYEEDWFSRGLTINAFWEALRKSYTDGVSVDLSLNN